MGLMAPFEWANAKLSTALGYAVRPVSKDYSEFLLMMGDNHYHPESLAKPHSGLPSDEGERFTKRVKQEIAPNVETAAVTYVQGVTGIGSAVAGTLIGAPATTGAIGFQSGEELVDAYLGDKEAPARSLRRAYGPDTSKLGPEVNTLIAGLSYLKLGMDVRGDAHYAAGGLVDQHPESARGQAHLQSLEENKRILASVKPQEKSFLDSATNDLSNGMTALSKKTSGFLGIGSIIGIIAAVALLPFSGLAALTAFAVSMIGQKAVSIATAEKQPVVAATNTAPTTNHPRAENTVPQQYIPQADLPNAKDKVLERH